MTVIALGTFDGVHAGHLALIRMTLAAAQEAGDTPLIHTFSNHPRGVFASAPKLLMRDEDRLSLLRAQGCEVAADTFTQAYADMSPQEFVQMLLERFAMRTVVTGFNYTFGAQGAGNVETLVSLGRELGFSVLTVPPCLYDGAPVSSTRIRACIEAGRMEAASAMLTRAYVMRGTVHSGRHIGRTLGFPTANIGCDPQLALPQTGVYATWVKLEEKTYPAITNIGDNPTVGGTETRVETHIMGFDGDLYGRTLDVRFASFLRGEVKFADTEKLGAQLARDRATALQKMQELPVYKDFSL